MHRKWAVLWLCACSLFAEDGLQGALIRNAIATMDAGRYAEAHELLNRHWTDVRARLGASHIETLRAQLCLGQVLTMLGRTREALDLLGPTVERTEAALGPNAPQTLAAEASLAVALRESRQFEGAEKLLTRVITAPTELTAVVRSDMLSQLALVLACRDKHRQALKFANEAVALSATVERPDSMRQLHLMLTLAQIQLSAGKIDAAEFTLRHVQTKAQGVWTADHPEQATLAAGLGIACFRKGRFSEAENHLRRAIEVAEKFLKPDHPEIASMSSCLAIILQQSGRRKEAQALQVKSLEIERRSRQAPVSVWSLRPVQ